MLLHLESMITETELRRKLSAMCNDTSQAQVARDLVISRAYISDIVAGRRRISKKIAKQLGYRLISIQLPVERQYEIIL